MKYVILIHSNPDPWGHPTQQLTAEGRALSAETHAEMDREFDALLTEISASGELVGAEALGDPASSTLFGWSPQGHLATDGPYAETRSNWPASSSSTASPGPEPRRSPPTSPSPAASWSCGRRCGRGSTTSDGGRLRGRVARVRAARPGRPGPTVRRLRHLRGRVAGGAAGGRPAVARGGGPRPPPRLAGHGCSRRLVDRIRSDRARTERELALRVDPGPGPASERDDSLTLLLLCCHPSLTRPSQVALTLRAVAGLSTAQIARGFMVPEATMAQRISRARASADEVTGLLALMRLTHARRDARTDADGFLVLLAEQDRSRWDRDLIAEGVAPVEEALPAGPVGPYQLQASIAAVHADAPDAAATDWPQIEVLYRMLHELAPGPAVTLNHAVAVGEARGPAEALAIQQSGRRGARPAVTRCSCR